MMPPKRLRSSADQDLRSSARSLWSFNSTHKSTADTNEHSGKDLHNSALHSRNGATGSRFVPLASIPFSVDIKGQHAQPNDTETVEAHEVNDLFPHSRSRAQKMSTALGRKENFPVIHLDDDEDHVEITGSRSITPRSHDQDFIFGLGHKITHDHPHRPKQARGTGSQQQRNTTQKRIDTSISPSEDSIVEGTKVEDHILQESVADDLQSLVSSPLMTSITQRGPRRSFLRRSKVDFIERQGLHIRKGVVVELHTGSFLWIDSVWNGDWGLRSMKGYRLLRDRDCGAIFPDQRVNEVVWFNKVDDQENQVGLESVIYEDNVSSVKQIRRVIFTNQPWDMLNYANEVGGKVGLTDAEHVEVERYGQLYCRWKLVKVQSKLKSGTDTKISLLQYGEADAVGGLEPGELRKAWGKGRPTGDSPRNSLFNIETDQVEKRYTLGDSFCGAGGVSRGAVQAGLKLAWAFDKNGDAIDAYEQNFQRYGTLALQMNDADFINFVEEQGVYADVVHYSPPCQGFSAANRHTNPEMDLINQQALFSLQSMTQKIKPRIVTIEETAGLMQRHRPWFDSLINTFTTIGYSIAWKIVPFQGLGVPQTRVRVLLSAAAPGDVLPPFPKLTHGEPGSGLKPYRMIRDVIYDIPAGASHQNTISQNLRPLPPFSDNTLAKCITTSGGQGNHHPSGRRMYSVRESASLQCFPHDHFFSIPIGVAKTQVGNAVPPTVAEALFKEVVKSLKETDGA